MNKGSSHDIVHRLRDRALAARADATPLGDARRFEDSAAEIERLRALLSLPVNDMRWALNNLLETIAAKFDGWETADIRRSEAASTVRGFKHELRPIGDARRVSERSRDTLDQIEQRLNEKGTGEMGMLDTIHAVAVLVRKARAHLALPRPHGGSPQGLCEEGRCADVAIESEPEGAALEHELMMGQPGPDWSGFHLRLHLLARKNDAK